MKELTIEEKQLLLQDLCAKLPYGVKIHLESLKYGELIGTLDAVYPTEERVIVDNLNKAIAPINVRCGGFNIEESNVKPYLRPMPSMTEEERNECNKMQCVYGVTSISRHGEMTDWLNAHHFDYRGLIGKGLAIEAPKGMYN